MDSKDKAAIEYLQSLKAIRERSGKLASSSDNLENFQVNLDNMETTVNTFPTSLTFLPSIIKELTKDDSIDQVPAHSRWRHFEVGGIPRVTQLLESLQWKNLDNVEKTIRILDLFVVSVLLDAGAGDKWTFMEESTGKTWTRSEGLAVASLEMFNSGLFSSDKSMPFQVDADALISLKVEDVARGLQVSDSNPLLGLEGRTNLLKRLGNALKEKTEYFSHEGKYRPGNLVYFLLEHAETGTNGDKKIIDLLTLWQVIIHGFGPIWPETRTKIGSVSMGDVWPCSALETESTQPYDNLIPFHKLSQWLTYSLLEPMQSLLKFEFINLELMTGLAEYRSGGLFVDFEVLKLKPGALERGLKNASEIGGYQTNVPLFHVHDSAVVEWRAMTIVLLDKIGDMVRSHYKKSEKELPLVKVLEGGTWKAGREIAAKKRPDTKCSPIQIVSDGTVF